jgi:hypothetical protein
MTVTDIRDLIASETLIQQRYGTISNAQVDSLDHIAGHSSRTKSKFYLSHSFDTYVEEGNEVYKSIGALTPQKSVFRNPPTPLEWGTDHPHYEEQGSRIPWTDFERDYVGKFVEKNKKRYTNVYSECLKAISKDQRAVSQFHRHHVESTGRVKYGYDKYIESKDKMCMSGELETLLI